MSQFENRIIKAINAGLNLSSDMYEKQHYVGRFISGWKQPKSCSNQKVGHRKIDIQIKSNTIYRVSRKVNIEIDGCQHDDPLSKLNDPQYDQKTGELKWTRSQIFNDQIDRDEWINLKSEENNEIMIRIKEPVWKSKNSAYDSQLKKLEEKLSSPGYIPGIIQECERKHAKGYIIQWDNDKIITKKRKWPKPKYYNGI